MDYQTTVFASPWSHQWRPWKLEERRLDATGEFLIHPLLWLTCPMAAGMQCFLVLLLFVSLVLFDGIEVVRGNSVGIYMYRKQSTVDKVVKKEHVNG